MQSCTLRTCDSLRRCDHSAPLHVGSRYGMHVGARYTGARVLFAQHSFLKMCLLTRRMPRPKFSLHHAARVAIKTIRKTTRFQAATTGRHPVARSELRDKGYSWQHTDSNCKHGERYGQHGRSCAHDECA